MKEFNLDFNLDIQVQLLGPLKSIADKCKYLENTYKLKSVVGKSFPEKRKNIVGYGIKQQEVPQFSNFGKNIL